MTLKDYKTYKEIIGYIEGNLKVEPGNYRRFLAFLTDYVDEYVEFEKKNHGIELRTIAEDYVFENYKNMNSKNWFRFIVPLYICTNGTTNILGLSIGLIEAFKTLKSLIDWDMIPVRCTPVHKQRIEDLFKDI